MSSRRLYFDNVFGWTYELACGRSPDINISENFLDFLVRSGLKKKQSVKITFFDDNVTTMHTVAILNASGPVCPQVFITVTERH